MSSLLMPNPLTSCRYKIHYFSISYVNFIPIVIVGCGFTDTIVRECGEYIIQETEICYAIEIDIM